MPKGIKKQPVKRKYTRRVQPGDIPIDLDAPDEKAFKNAPPKEMDELEFLDLVVTGVGQMSAEQKNRFMNYIYSRYWTFITLSKLTQ